MSLFDSGTVSSVFDPNGPFGPVTVNTFAYQWDLSSVACPITSFDVEYTLDGTSGQIYAMQLDQGDSFAAQAVPEPGAFAALAGTVALGFAAAGRRRRRIA